MPLRFAFLLFEEHPWGREMLRGLIERGYEPELIVQEISEVAAVEREKLLARMGGQCIAPRVVEQVRERVIPVWYVHNLNSDFCGELLAADPPDLLVMGGAAHRTRDNPGRAPHRHPKRTPRSAANLAWHFNGRMGAV